MCGSTDSMNEVRIWLSGCIPGDEPRIIQIQPIMPNPVSQPVKRGVLCVSTGTST